MPERAADNSLTPQESVAHDEERKRLLLLFHPDPERAQRDYEKLCSRLVKMCECRGFVRSEELIRETFRIVSRELLNERISVFAVRVAQKLLNEISQENFRRLIEALDPDPTQAGMKYEAIRIQLVKFFGSRNCRNPEELADRSLDRLAKRLATVDVKKFSSYARRIAKFVVQESWRAPEEIPIESKNSGDIFLSAPSLLDEIVETVDEDEEIMTALDRCLDQLEQAKRDLILAYHNTTPETEEYLRKQLARQAGITMNALRAKVCRIRKTLEICVMGESSGIITRSDSS
jgi:hypothetical protein